MTWLGAEKKCETKYKEEKKCETKYNEKCYVHKTEYGHGWESMDWYGKPEHYCVKIPYEHCYVVKVPYEYCYDVKVPYQDKVRSGDARACTPGARDPVVGLCHADATGWGIHFML